MFRKRKNSKQSRGIASSNSRLRFEQLEGRLCLSGNPLIINPNLHGFGPSLEDFAAGPPTEAVVVPAAIADKINAPLWSAIQEELDGGPTATPVFNSSPLHNGMAHRSPSGDIEIVVEVASWTASVLDDLSALGIETALSNESLKMVQGWASAVEIDVMLVDSNVAHVSLPVYGVTNTGAVNTEGDAILQADDVRSTFTGINGSGVKVGVISDGVQNRTTVDNTGDLPTSITVNPSLPGSGDEGTAMLEIIHDLAPGAQLFFSSGLSGTLAMIDSVNWLVSQGVDIIVDDLSFFTQPYFQDGAIANAVASAVASGVSYFSAAGNQAQDHYQADFSSAGTFSLDGVNHEVHNFGAGDTSLAVTIVGDGVSGSDGIAELDVILQWSDAFGGSSNDYGIFFVDSNGQVLARADVLQNGSQDPIERLFLDYSGVGSFNGFLVIGSDVGEADREFEMFIFNDTGQELALPTDGIVGHQARTEVVTVGAINEGDPGNDAIAFYSSRGQSTVYTSFTTQTSTTRSTLDGAAIDGVQTRTGDLGYTNAFGASLDPFFGTSAAAPHVAGIAALLLDINPALSPAGVAAILAKHAVDILGEGYDATSGFGRFDAYTAATSGIEVPKVTDVLLDGSTWTRDPYSFREIIATDSQLAPIFTQGVNTIQVEFSEHVLLNSTDLTLYRVMDWTVVPSNFSYNAGTHVGTWTFTNPLPADKYRLELSTDIEDASGNALDGEWENDTSGTPDDFSDDPTGRAFLSGNGVAGVPGNEFQFLFSTLPGDRNQDGAVTNADSSVAGDVDGDYDSDATDTTLVTGYLHTSLFVRKNRGDYNDDENTEDADYMIWRATYGSTTDLRADGNGNLAVDTPDYSVWRNSKGAISAWANTVAPGGGTFAPQVLVGVAPKVTNVTVSGSSSLHDPYSFDDEGADGSGEQLRTVPVGGADTISITFSEDVNVDANHLRLTGMYTANVPELAEFSYDIGTMTATWRFTGLTFGDMYLISVNDAITDIEGDALDGEWTNPAHLNTTNTAVSEFPSGDGNPGGRFSFVLTLLAPDANRDNLVTEGDFDVLYANWELYGSYIDWSWGDLNGDQGVDSDDAGVISDYPGLLDFQVIKLLADLDNDWDVDQDDLDLLFANWGLGLQNPTEEDGDLDGDIDIDIDDFDLAFAQWGLELSVVS